jgi:tetratricopeptide (TPR) repeat protein
LPTWAPRWAERVWSIVCFVIDSRLRRQGIATRLLERACADVAGRGPGFLEAYARKHAHDDAGVLANLALGYAHILDHEPAKAITPLKLAQARAGDLADYTAYFLGASYQATGQTDLAIDSLSGEPHYHLACYYSRAGRKDQALEELAKAVARNPKLGTQAKTDSDLAPLKEDPRFKKLIGS